MVTDIFVFIVNFLGACVWLALVIGCFAAFMWAFCGALGWFAKVNAAIDEQDERKD